MPDAPFAPFRPMTALLQAGPCRRRHQHGAGRGRRPAHLLSPGRGLAARHRRADHAARRRPHHALPVEAGQGRAARPAPAGAAVAPVRHLLGAAHPLSGRRPRRRMDQEAQQPRRSSPASPPSTGCWAARSPICSSSASTSTRNAAARPRPGRWAVDPKSVPLARVSWRPSYRLIPSRFPTVGLYDAIADCRRSRRGVRDRGARQSAAARRDRRAAAGAAGGAGERPGSDAGDGRLHPPQSGRLALLRRQLRRLLRRALARHRGGRGEPPSGAVPAPHRRAGDRSRHAPDHRQRRGGAARPAHPGRARSRRSGRTRRSSIRRTTARRSASAQALRRQGSWGISYPSVRDAEGECVAIFRPRALRHAKSALHIALHWDGERISALVREARAALR